MAAQSDFFECLFTHEEDKFEYKISDVSATAMKLILDGFYEIDISEDEDLDEEMKQEILATAQYFQAPFLKKKAMDIFIFFL